MTEDVKNRRKKNKRKSDKKEKIKILIRPKEKIFQKMPRRAGGRKPSHILRHDFHYKPELKLKPKPEKISWGKAEPWTEPSIKNQPKVIKYEVDIEKLLKQLEKHFDEELLEKVLKAIDSDKKLEAEPNIKTEIEADKFSDAAEPNIEKETSEHAELETTEATVIDETKKEPETKISESALDAEIPKEAVDVEPEMTRNNYLEMEAETLQDMLADEELVEKTEPPVIAEPVGIETLPAQESIEPQLEDYGVVEIEAGLVLEEAIEPEIEPVIDNEIEAEPAEDAEY